MRSTRELRWAATALIVVALAVRTWLVGTGTFYWDDLIIIGRASTHPVGSADFLLHPHDGHVMPGAFLVAGLSTLLAPLNWGVAAATLIVGQALAAVAVWRMIRVIAPRSGWWGLGVLAFYLFTPMTVPAFTWWASGLNTLPMQIALAVVVADAVLLTRASRTDDAPRPRPWILIVRSTLLFAVAIAFFEKSLLILPVALVAAMLVARGDRDGLVPVRTAIVSALRRGRWLWTAMGAVAVFGVIGFLMRSDITKGEASASQTVEMVWRSINRGVVPATIGGPWSWERWWPAAPFGQPSVMMIVVGWLLLAGVVALAIVRRRAAFGVLLAAASYIVGAQTIVMWNRSSVDTMNELGETLRYLPDTAVVLVIAAAIILARPSRREAAPASDAADAEPSSEVLPPVAVATLCAVALLVTSSLMSTIGFSRSWNDTVVDEYLATAGDSMAALEGEVMLDHPVPLEVLLPLTFPENQVSHLFGRLPQRPDFGTSTQRLWVLDTTGQVVAGAVTPRRELLAGIGDCGRPEVFEPTRIWFDGPLVWFRWDGELQYCANIDGLIELSLDGGEPIRVPVRKGLNTVWFQLTGEGESMAIRPLTPGLAVHTAGGHLGEVVDARLL